MHHWLILRALYQFLVRNSVINTHVSGQYLHNNIMTCLNYTMYNSLLIDHELSPLSEDVGRTRQETPVIYSMGPAVVSW